MHRLSLKSPTRPCLLCACVHLRNFLLGLRLRVRLRLHSRLSLSLHLYLHTCRLHICVCSIGDCMLRLWDAESTSCVLSLSGHHDHIQVCVLSLSGHHDHIQDSGFHLYVVGLRIQAYTCILWLHLYVVVVPSILNPQPSTLNPQPHPPQPLNAITPRPDGKVLNHTLEASTLKSLKP